MQLNQEPLRVLLEQSESKGFRKKKEIVKYAVGDENGNPLTAFNYASIDSYDEDGFAQAAIPSGKEGQQMVVLDLSGNLLLKEYTDKHYNVTKLGNALVLKLGSYAGLANMDGKVLIEPKTCNHINIADGVIIFGRLFPQANIMDSSELGAAKLVDGELVEIIPHGKHYYNLIESMGDGYLAVGRIVVNRNQTVSTGSIKPGYKTTYQPQLAVQFFTTDGVPVSDKVFGFTQMPKRSRDGKLQVVYYPNIKPEELKHQQSMGEAFKGTGLLDFSKSKNVRLDTEVV